MSGESVHPALSASRADKVLGWLRTQGLQYYPFAYTESERDDNLESYYVEHPAFKDNLKPAHGLIYAEPGGGKTATRLRLQSYFRDEFPVQRIFAFSYLIENPSLAHLDDHIAPLLRSVSQWAFVLFALHGHEFPALKRMAAQFSRFFEAYYPVPSWREDLQEALRSGSLRQCLANLGFPFDEEMPPAAPGSVNTRWLKQWLALLTEAPANSSSLPEDNWAKWHELRGTLIGSGVSAMIALIDGVDAQPGSYDEEAMLSIARPLVQAMRHNALGERVYLKLFLPVQLFVPLIPDQGSDLPAYFIRWDSTQLSEMIHARLAAASGGTVRYLSQLADSSVQNLEDYLLSEAGRSPRALLQIIRELLEVHTENFHLAENGTTINYGTIQRFRKRRSNRAGTADTLS